VNSVDQSRGRAKVSWGRVSCAGNDKEALTCVIDFVLKQDACYFMSEAWGVYRICRADIEIGIKSAGLHGEHEVSCTCSTDISLLVLRTQNE
jgi:hypothetical protein